MKLNKHQGDNDNAEHGKMIRDDLIRLISQPDQKEMRPCPGCNKPCPCCGSPTCTCSCTPDCADASMILSSEPDRYPIEENILSLVFGFHVLRVCPPYWSCEGHLFSDGKIRRQPQVWFYSRSLIYPKLISEYVVKLKVNNRLYYPWQVVVSHSDEPLETGFTLQPVWPGDSNLVRMQQDARVIGASLQTGLKEIAQRYLDSDRVDEAVSSAPVS